MNNQPQKPIALIGMMGTGKSTIGKLVAAELGLPFVDSDHLIEKRTGQSVREIFMQKGETAFREMEHQALTELTDTKGKGNSRVIGTGGGCVTNPNSLDLLKGRDVTIWLKASPADIYERIKNDQTRPLLQTKDPLATIEKLSAERAERYSQADIIIDTKQNAEEETAQAVINALQPHL